MGDSRVFTAALDGLVHDEAEILENAIGMPLPESPAKEDALEVFPESAVEEFATGFAAHHDPMVWDDELWESRPRPIQKKVPRSTRHLSGETIVPSVEDQPQLVDDEPVRLVDYEVPAWYHTEQEAQWKQGARAAREHTTHVQVPLTQQPAAPCVGTESCATRIARLELQNELLTTKAEILQEKNEYLRLFAVGVSCLLIGGALVVAQP